MGILQSICLRGKEEDEQKLHNNKNYRKPNYNGSSFGLSSFYTHFKNLILRIFKLLPFAKSRKPEPTLPVVKPTKNPHFLQIQDTPLSSSDSSSNPNTTYATPPDFQLQSDHYSSSEDEVHSTTTTWLQKPPVSSSMESGSNEDKGSCHIKQMDMIIDVPSFDYKSFARTNTSAMQRLSNENEGLWHIKQMDVIIDVPSLDYQSLASTNTFDNKENNVKEVEEEKVINCCVKQGKWITHYNSYHWMLLVGEGDFSFSASLAVAFGNAPNMIATSLNSIEYLRKTYSHAMSNIEKLRRRGCTVLHGIDATKIATPDLFGGMTFDRIIFNFPHAGFFKELPRDAQRRKHQELVSLFLKNARELIGGDGEIHISHKTNGFHREWMLESLASSHKLRLIEAVDFNRYDYKGYHTKYGFETDNNFNCHPSKTYKFGLKRSLSSAY